MSKGNSTIAWKKDTSTLVRPTFSPGMLLQHEDLEALNSYARELNRLMFRSLFGCGVVCGLVVKVNTDKVCGKVSVSVGAGLALDCSGGPVYVPKDQTFPLDEHCDPNIPDQLWVVLCGATKHCAPRASMCESDDDKATPVCTRERDMFEIRVVSKRPECACGCSGPSNVPGSDPNNPTYGAQKAPLGQEGVKDPCLCADPTLDCHKDHYAGKCGCNCGDGCDCECILLARLDVDKNADDSWTVDHRVRRFIRPVLMRDPQVESEELYRKDAGTKAHFAQDFAAAEQGVRVAYRTGSAAADVANKAAEAAKAAAAIRAEKLAAAKTAAEQVARAKAAADQTNDAAKRAKAAADRANKQADKAAAAMAATEADKAAELAKVAAAEVDRVATMAKEADIASERAIADADKAEASASKAMEDRVAADRAVAAAIDKVDSLAKAMNG